MADYVDNNAVYALNSYVWKLLEANLGWTKNDYKGKTPIIPTAQQPEFLETGKAFIVYGSAIHPSFDVYALRAEAVSYNIYSPSSTEANRIANLLTEVFARQDVAAADVNDWLDFEEPSRTTAPRGISFGSVRSVLTEKAEPADEEGGYVSALVMLETKYTIDERSVGGIKTVFSTP